MYGRNTETDAILAHPPFVNPSMPASAQWDSTRADIDMHMPCASEPEEAAAEDLPANDPDLGPSKRENIWGWPVDSRHGRMSRSRMHQSEERTSGARQREYKVLSLQDLARIHSSRLSGPRLFDHGTTSSAIRPVFGLAQC